jgi:hypothetical protein
MISLGACTTEPEDDDGNQGGGFAGTPAGGAGVPAAGAGGAGGAAAGAGGAAAGAGGSAGMAAPPVMCGGMMCNAVMSANGPLPACCDTANGDICGATVSMDGMQCVGVGQSGEDDPSCPMEMSVIMTPLAGCCKEDGKCGVRSGTLMGCIERTQYPVTFLAAPAMGMMAAPLTAADCGGGGAGMGAGGAGAGGAGGEGGAGAGGAGAGGAGAGGAGAGGAGAGGAGAGG